MGATVGSTGGITVRNLEVAIFVVGVLSFVLSAFFAGQGMGDILWRAGVAAMLTDLALRALWPATGRS
jgi:hypothetical protein